MRWRPARRHDGEGPAWAPPTALDTPAVLRELEHFRLWHLQRIRRQRGGEFLGRTRGGSSEFRDYRPYSPGDDFRLIDWGLYIRLDRVYVKTFLDEEYRHVHVLLDNSRSMKSGDRKKFAVARDLALALSYLSLLNDDRVVLGLLADPPGRAGRAGRTRGGGEGAGAALRGPRSLALLRGRLSRIRPQGVFDPLRSLEAHALRQGRRPGLAVIISDLLVPAEDLHAGLEALARRRFAVAVIEVRDPRDESFPGQGSLGSGTLRAIDQETGEARLYTVDAENIRRHQEAVRLHRAGVDAACARLGIPIARHRTDGNAEEFLLRHLPSTGLLRARGRG